jgi:hypothetical protein
VRLTRDEILLIAIIFAALLIGAAAKSYRVTHARATPTVKLLAAPFPPKKIVSGDD